MKRIFIILTLIVMSLASYAGTFNQQAAIKEISAAAAALKTMQCDFVQTKSLKMLGDKMVSKGKMYCSQPDKLKWQYLTPYQYTFILNGNKVGINKGSRSNVVDVQKNKGGKFMHYGKVTSGTIKVGDSVKLLLDPVKLLSDDSLDFTEKQEEEEEE